MPFFHGLVILFARYPCPGRCKSRLIPSLGKERATQIHRQLVDHSLTQILAFLTRHDKTSLHIYYHESSLEQMHEWLGNSLSYHCQEGADLGARMANALYNGQQAGYDTILMGSDCPDIDTAILTEALAALQTKDLVIGPAHDGGYYLIGVAKNLARLSYQELFRNIPWGSNTVLQETLNRVKKLKLSTHTLPTLHDIDTPKDLKYFHHSPHPQ